MSEQLNFLDQLAGQGFENHNTNDFQIPFLRILQPLSPQCQEKSSDYIKGAKPGMFYNTLTNELYGESVEVIPIFFEKNWLEWQPERGGFVASHEPDSIEVDKSNFSKWVALNGNTITEHYNFYCIISGQLIILSLSSSAIKHAKNWNSQLSLVRLPNGSRAPIFSSVWKLTATYNENDKGNWYSIGAKQANIERVRYINQEEYSQIINPTRQNLLETNLKNSVDYKQIANEDIKEVNEVSDSEKIEY